MREFKSIIEFQKHFDTDDKCRQHLEQTRWNGTPACPFCGSINLCMFKTGKLFNCRDCRKNFSVTVGTILHKMLSQVIPGKSRCSADDFYW